jgi:hypothetical protein
MCSDGAHHPTHEEGPAEPEGARAQILASCVITGGAEPHSYHATAVDPETGQQRTWITVGAVHPEFAQIDAELVATFATVRPRRTKAPARRCARTVRPRSRARRQPRSSRAGPDDDPGSSEPPGLRLGPGTFALDRLAHLDIADPWPTS